MPTFREREQWFLTAAAREKKPLILDADGLNLLAMHPQWKEFLGENVILTPHMGWKGLETRQRLVSILAANIQAFDEGRPQNVVS